VSTPESATCACGKSIPIPAEFLGKSIRCPVCQVVVDIPWNHTADFVEAEVFEEVEVAKCPRCRKEWPQGTVICIDCGYSFKTGGKLRTRYKVRDKYVDVGLPEFGIYSRYAIVRAKDGDLKFTLNQWFLWIPLGSRTVALDDYRQVATDFGPSRSNPGGKCNHYTLALHSSRKKPVHIWQGESEKTFRQLVELFQEAGLTVTRS
jgi:hypothetical protein